MYSHVLKFIQNKPVLHTCELYLLLARINYYMYMHVYAWLDYVPYTAELAPMKNTIVMAGSHMTDYN